MQLPGISPTIPATEAPTDLSRARLAIVVGNQIMSVPAVGLGNAFGFQPLDSDLTAIAALTTTAFGRSVLELANAAAGRSLWGLGTAATQNTGTSGANIPLLDGSNTWANVQTFSAIPSLTSGGILFPATQVASANANTLDDYEEGTFTPAYSASGSTFSYASQSGDYTKIGNFVFFNIAIFLNTSGNTLTANSLTITGLPFAANTASGRGVFPLRWSGSTTSFVWVSVRALGATLVVEHLTAASTSLTATAANQLLHATNGMNVQLLGAYRV